MSYCVPCTSYDAFAAYAVTVIPQQQQHVVAHCTTQQHAVALAAAAVVHLAAAAAVSSSTDEHSQRCAWQQGALRLKRQLLRQQTAASKSQAR
jgi:hypothetical protein